MYASCAFSINSGLPPTPLNARTGEFTPPGITDCARSKSCLDMLIKILLICSLKNITNLLQDAKISKPRPDPLFINLWEGMKSGDYKSRLLMRAMVIAGFIRGEAGSKILSEV
jgi:hypothetical protein